MNIGGEGRDYDSLITVLKQFIETLSYLAFRSGVTGCFNVS